MAEWQPRIGPPPGASRWLVLLLVVLLASTACATRDLPPGAGPPRLLPLSGTLNTRDLGGYETEDGRRVRMGRLYRSDQLSDLDRQDVARLEEIGLRTVFDLRTEAERHGEPDRLPAGTRLVPLTMSHPSMDPQVLANRILWGNVSEDYFEQMLVRANRTFALDHGRELAELVRDLVAADTFPALLHCTYGKDRTGFASAMILEILGVPWETVVEDYLLSNAYLKPRIDRTARLIWIGSRFRISRESARDLLGVNRAYLESARQAILDEHGSSSEYLKAIGLDDSTLERLRDALLEPDPAAGGAGP